MRRQLSLLLIASFLTFFAGLGRGAVSDSDEGFYAEAAREMVESGDWITPRFNYVERFEKPILYYWFAAAAFSIMGVTETAARLPSAASGVLLVLVSWCWGRRWLSDRTGVIAGLIVASNFGYFAIGRLALPDLPLALFMTVAAWAGFEAALAFNSAQRRASRSGWAWLLLASVSAALAFLMKGPVGVLLPGLAVWLATRVGWTGSARWLPFPIGPTLIAVVLFVAIAAPWFAAMTAEHGVAYLHRFFVSENVERFATDRYNEPRSPFFYVPILLGGLGSWAPVIGVWASIARWQRRAATSSFGSTQRVLLLWAAVPFIFYSLSIGKQPRYILPVLPPIAILLAEALATVTTGKERHPVLSWAFTLSGLLLVVLGALLLRAMPLLAAANEFATPLVGVLIVVGGLVIMAAAWWWPSRITETVAAVSIATLFGLQVSVYSPRGTDPVEQFAATILQERQQGEAIGTHRALVRNLVFYTKTEQTDLPEFEHLVQFLDRADRVLCVVRQRDLDRLRAESGLTPHVISSLPYFNTAGLRINALLTPNLQRDLETIHLIANRPRLPGSPRTSVR